MKFCGLDALPEGLWDRRGTPGRDSFFNLPQWYRLVAEHALGANSRAGFAVDDEARIAVAFARSSRDRILRSCTNLYTCDFAILGETDNSGEMARFFGDLLSSAKPLDGLQLEGLCPESGNLPALLEAIRSAGLVAKPYFCWANWFEPTEGLDFQQYFARRPSVLRNTWRRKVAALRRSARAEFLISRHLGDATAHMALYEKLREQSWKAAEPYPRFIPELIGLAARLGALRFGILTIDGVPAAAQFWIVWSRRATIYKLVHAKGFDNHSPGTLLTMEMVRDVLENDHTCEIDFGRGNDTYKKLWMSSRRERWGIEAANPRTPRGLLQALRIGAARRRVWRRKYGGT